MSSAHPVPVTRVLTRRAASSATAANGSRMLSRRAPRGITPALAVSVAVAAAGLALQYVGGALITQGARALGRTLRGSGGVTRTIVTEYVVVERGHAPRGTR